MLSQKLNIATGFSIKAQQNKAGSIQFNLNKVAVPQIGKEGYTLYFLGKRSGYNLPMNLQDSFMECKHCFSFSRKKLKAKPQLI